MIKVLVFFLTFTIIFGMILAGLTIYRKVQHPRSIEIAQLNLEQPKGSQISDIKTSDGMLHLLISGGQTSDRIISVRTSDHRVAAIINLN